jgi:hypothetical protein
MWLFPTPWPCYWSQDHPDLGYIDDLDGPWLCDSRQLLEGNVFPLLDPTLSSKCKVGSGSELYRISWHHSLEGDKVPGGQLTHLYLQIHVVLLKILIRTPWSSPLGSSLLLSFSHHSTRVITLPYTASMHNHVTLILACSWLQASLQSTGFLSSWWQPVSIVLCSFPS